MTPTPQRRRRRTLIIGLSAAVTLILAGTAIAAAWLFGGTLADAKPAANQLDTVTQIECDTIRREFEAWNKDITRLDSNMVKSGGSSIDRSITRNELDRLTEAGKAFAKAATGRQDQPAKELSVAVATYNVELGMVSLQHQLGGGVFEEPQRKKAVQAAVTVEQAYRKFSQQTCGTK